MKRTCFAFLSQCLLVIIILTSCSDDQTGLSPDINIPITGYWQIADGDINGDGAIQGIVVHSDETVSEWLYTGETANPYQLGFKTGKWSVNGNHYEMQLPISKGAYYNVTVAGNNDRTMYLAYKGKTSVVPFYKLTSLPENGNEMISELEGMKMSGYTMADITGYWEQDNENGTGFYIDNEGNISDLTCLYSEEKYYSVEYHSAEVILNGNSCVISSLGSQWMVYAVGSNSLLAIDRNNNSQQVEHFVKKDVPDEMMRADEIMKAPVSAGLLGKWETIHYTHMVNGENVTDIDTLNGDDWNKQFYHTLAFSENHKICKWDWFGSQLYDQCFMLKGDNITIAENLTGLLFPKYSYTETWTISDKTENSMKLTREQDNTTECYTYKRK